MRLQVESTTASPSSRGPSSDRVAIGEEEPLPHLERRVAVRNAECAQALGFMRWSSGHGGTAVDATWAPRGFLPLTVDDVVHRNQFEADDGDRTRDPQLGKLMLYQLSYVRAGSILAWS